MEDKPEALTEDLPPDTRIIFPAVQIFQAGANEVQINPS
jgi:hypothetical protein